MSQPIVYARGDPKTTRYVQQLKLIGDLVEVSTTMYVTAEHWGWVIAELDAQYAECMMDPTRPAPWKLRPNKPMRYGKAGGPCLTVINSGTDDEQVVYLLNEEPAMVANFGARRDKLRIA